MSVFDFFLFYLYFVKYIAIFLIIFIFLFGVDDLFIDLMYWKEVLLGVNSKENREENVKTDIKQSYMAIMIPAWQEDGVIEKMVSLLASSCKYDNFHIFVGTYPNDLATTACIEEVCTEYKNVHNVICKKPGPTSKADCLNNIFKYILFEENRKGIKFSGFILHDSEDVTHSYELSLFNTYLPEYDLIQIPVYPYVRKWYQFTSSHYIDEFSELHEKDLLVRMSMTGHVPSAGVGTCLSRRALFRLARSGGGKPFDCRSLTEDYDISVRLKQWGMSEIFVRSVAKNISFKDSDDSDSPSLVCVREFFPSSFNAAVRQKSRWIIGIVFQGWKNIGWSKNWKMNYFLWRDRRCVLSNTVSFLSMAVFLQIACISIYQIIFKDSYFFLSIFDDYFLLEYISYANILFFINRLIHRFIFVRRFYGLLSAFISIPRTLWSNIINFFSNIRALYLVFSKDNIMKISWDKTKHDFPDIKNS
ncbi:phage adsorption protein NrfB [Vibrio sp. Of14-4]|uniref:glycosyl transferase family protein n=1 Tax=Vibrio sp. Of14-4 TaxID=2724878 RepID=UPI001EF2B3FA|nr:glycosyl transferase family protein [Vibrio sp. Of14-4]MCG7488596.1 phage adsorption protein NrfB [Vibrio sp. Of14-4]